MVKQILNQRNGYRNKREVLLKQDEMEAESIEQIFQKMKSWLRKPYQEMQMITKFWHEIISKYMYDNISYIERAAE